MIVIVLAVVATGGYLLYLYRQGDPAHYLPPTTPARAPRAEALARLRVISRAVDAYYLKNLRYPAGLQQLTPDFLAAVPKEPGGGVFIYQSDGVSHYRVAVSDPQPYAAKELAVEDGKIIAP